jgi:formyl-CoA transferase
MNALPLSGVTVVSVEQAVAAPFATRQLADLGARVIKVERPDGGDFARRYDTTVHGQSSYFVWLNRSKESVTLDLKSAAGQDVLRMLLERADVFVQNLGPGAAGRLGLDADTLTQLFPSLIPCTVTGFGTDGPWADRKAYDLLVQCQTGLVSLTGTADETARAGVSVADIAAGMYAYSGILTALYVRAVTGAVRPVEVSLFEALAEWMSQPAYYTRHGGSQPPRLGTQHATIAPYGAYTAADGKQVLLSVQNEREWVSLCKRLLGRPEMADDPRFATGPDRVIHRDELNALIGAWTHRHDSDEVQRLLHEAGIACAGVNDVQDFVDHPVLAARNRWRDVAVPGAVVPSLVPPVDLAGVEPRMDPVPETGGHTAQVLSELGLTAVRIAELRADGVI